MKYFCLSVAARVFVQAHFCVHVAVGAASTGEPHKESSEEHNPPPTGHVFVNAHTGQATVIPHLNLSQLGRRKGLETGGVGLSSPTTSVGTSHRWSDRSAYSATSAPPAPMRSFLTPAAGVAEQDEGEPEVRDTVDSYLNVPVLRVPGFDKNHGVNKVDERAEVSTCAAQVSNLPRPSRQRLQMKRARDPWEVQESNGGGERERTRRGAGSWNPGGDLSRPVEEHAHEEVTLDPWEEENL